MKLCNNYSLNIIRKFDDYIDFEIYYKDNIIGTLGLRINEIVFIRQISIKKEYQRSRHATNILEELLFFYKKPIRLCVATCSESAILFWDSYLKTKKHTHIRGQIYEINI